MKLKESSPKISKTVVKKTIASSANLEEAAYKLGMDRRTLYSFRVRNNMPVAVRG